ncbi:molybdate ABC transporter, permease protein ModB [Aeropyrum pernix K1]|uniref:Molybdate ABC transporter, permease protein ModB n=1 Tax=Aeropyrum pernix (strain ATCC 700893 / DSM 11879 / JCM 9820 / NBRC 100138 / K1) TaxID=272557 RepID=Q9YFH4_AERPE|nr:molybdate ABC transporter, permease protein ModB [Aeropyrum pernix K1]
MLRVYGVPTALSIALGLASLAIVASPIPMAASRDLIDLFLEERFRRSLVLSLGSSTISSVLAVTLATAPAYAMARQEGRLTRLISQLHLLLLSIPPVGLGTAALILFTRYPPLNSISETLGLFFSPKAVILAQLLVTTPIAVSMLTGVFSMVPRELEEAAEAYGAGRLQILIRIVLPLSLPGILSALAVTFFRALGEFGATLVLAGNIPGRTETLPLALYNAISLADVETASAIYTLVLAVGLVTLGVHTLLYTRLVKRTG